MVPKRLPVRLSLGLAIWAAWSGCLCQDPIGQKGSGIPGRCTDNPPRVNVQKTDILFVVDDSSSMTDKQNAVARELPAFVGLLQQGAGVQQDFQMGLITTSVYQYAWYPPPPDPAATAYYRFFPTKAGRLQPVPVSTDGGDVMELDGGGTATCSSGEKILDGGDPCLVNKFSRLVRVGVQGSGQETPFEATRLATTVLQDTPLDQGGNQGFLRDGAQLLVVTVMDEDDCSEFADIFDAGWRPQVIIGSDKNVAPNFTDYCTQQSAKLAPLQSYVDILNGLTDGQGNHRAVIWGDIAPVSLIDKSAAVIQDRDAGTNRNVGCPDSFGVGIRHHDMAALLDSSLSDLDSICDPSYHQALLDIAAKAVAGQQISVSGIPDPGLLTVAITRANGSVQSCTISGTDLPGTNGAADNITFSTSSSGQQQVQFHGACERRVDDLALTIELLCAN